MKFEQEFNWVVLVSNLPRNLKKLILIIFDSFSLAFTCYVSFSLAIESLTDKHALLLGVLFVFVSLAGLLSIGIYRAVIRYSGIRVLELITVVQLISVITTALCSRFFYGQLNVVLLLLLFLLSIFFLGGARLAAREIIYLSRPFGKRILIYGARKDGIQLLTSLRQDINYDVIGFVADEEDLHGNLLHGVKVFPSSKLSEIVGQKNVSIVVLALPNASRQDLRNILDKLEPLSVVVKTLPKISDFLDGKNAHEQLQEVKFEELLGRERVSPNEELLKENITDKVVLVTGAGGSIGSELCRQIVTREPKRLILVELSELALFNIEQELVVDYEGLIKTVLASVGDFDLMQSVLSTEKVQTVYHAAAYKHVPLVETNPFSAVYNNVFGTQSILNASIASGVSSFTLVSTDKAVRPTNVMGATKRLAEILCQVASATNGDKTTISMVRFGNVIGSSGSAIPKFREQIKVGGPVTVTHPDITRYFMVIPEAVELVLQASSLAKGGEVFVLDMGTPIKIADLVKKLIRFSGNFVGDEQHKRLGAINIEYTGLRPGEKLYEELLIYGDIESTIHPKIKKISELYPQPKDFEVFVDELKGLCKDRDEVALRDSLSRQGIGYVVGEKIRANSDHLGNQLEKSRAEESSEPNSLDGRNYKTKQNLMQRETETVQAEVIKKTPKTAISKRIFLFFLHKYFLFTRPLTMGTRCVILNDDNEIFLVEHTYVSGWHLPGGGIEVGESAEIAIKREVAEETLLDLIGVPKLVGIYHCNTVTERDHVVVFMSKTFKNNYSNTESFEIKSGRFFPISSLPTDVDEFAKDWISDVLEIEAGS